MKWNKLNETTSVYDTGAGVLVETYSRNGKALCFVPGHTVTEDDEIRPVRNKSETDDNQ